MTDKTNTNYDGLEVKEQPYNGWLVSPDIIKRSFAVLGHSTLATAILYLPLIFLLMCAGMSGGR